MNELIESVRKVIEPVVHNQGLFIDKLDFCKKGKDFYLVIYVEKEDDSTSLDEVCQVSDLISKELDKADIISQNYILDVSTSGAERPIKDFTKFPKYVGKYVYIKLRNPVEGNIDYTGTIEKVENDMITLSYRVKTRTKIVTLDISNITKANLAIKF